MCECIQYKIKSWLVVLIHLLVVKMYLTVFLIYCLKSFCLEIICLGINNDQRYFSEYNVHCYRNLLCTSWTSSLVL